MVQYNKKPTVYTLMKILKNIFLLSLCLSIPAHAISGEELAKRQCRSVHTGYTANSPDASAAYAEVEVQKSAQGTYYCALGFHMGYLGMQELSNGKKVIIFSVWEPHHGEQAANVPESKRAKLIRKGEGVRTARFGGEGTGGQSFFDYDWKMGENLKFFVQANKINETTTRYTGYFYDNQKSQWQLMTEFQTLAKGKMLGSGLYSFVEDFKRNYESTTIDRTAHFKNGWSMSPTGEWSPLASATFTADPTPSNHIDAGPLADGFFLTTGGKTEMKTTKLWSKMTREVTHQAPPQNLPLSK